MNILITAGGTSEPIDSVRKITNSSSGKLGSIIANTLVDKTNVEKIFYVCSKKSVLPNDNTKIEIIFIETVAQLLNKMKDIILSDKIDVVIHSMAVSDYQVQYITNTDILSQNLINKSSPEIIDILNNRQIGINNQDKVSSNMKDMIIKLVPTPKVISQIKKWNNNIFLVGFKLLSNASTETLLEKAKKLMEVNDCDIVVANDIKNISAKKHQAFIIQKDNSKILVNSKEEIAETLSTLLNKLKKSQS